ncbi:MAG: hypothetical protein QOH90_414 [Actinomycetota bacterium]|jgi:hypothetical protein|nr:hypothetical protein [Actinomycetota bacterium]
MKTWMRLLAVGGSAALLLGGIGSVVVANMTLHQASDALAGAHRLYSARVDVANAQKGLGRSQLKKALKGAIEANTAADGVRRSTARILPLLTMAEDRTTRTATASTRTTRVLGTLAGDARRASSLLRLIAAEEKGSSHAASLTNTFLRRILVALRKTNRSFPG